MLQLHWGEKQCHDMIGKQKVYVKRKAMGTDDTLGFGFFGP
jgi:hypothetical protein